MTLLYELGLDQVLHGLLSSYNPLTEIFVLKKKFLIISPLLLQLLERQDSLRQWIDNQGGCQTTVSGVNCFGINCLQQHREAHAVTQGLSITAASAVTTVIHLCHNAILLITPPFRDILSLSVCVSGSFYSCLNNTNEPEVAFYCWCFHCDIENKALIFI